MKRLALLLPLLVLACLLTPASAAATATYDSEIVRYTNAQRARYGLAPLKVSYCVKGHFADPWARHLAATRALSHQSLTPIMSTCHGTAAGENVARANVSPGRMVEMWMGSSGHRANILNPRYNYIGVGAVRGSDRYVYAVQDFLRYG
ncbi:MAG: CAP domain-containing protein [Mycobacteriales bacterium]